MVSTGRDPIIGRTVTLLVGDAKATSPAGRPADHGSRRGGIGVSNGIARSMVSIPPRRVSAPPDPTASRYKNEMRVSDAREAGNGNHHSRILFLIGSPPLDALGP